MNCIIVDDEPLAHKVIIKYVDNLPFVDIAKSCYTAIEALEYLNSNLVDLIFLDINMPKLKGLDFLRTLSDPPLIIVTTAYQEFALESYELDICDYLLKPFSFERFIKAVNKAQNQKKLIEKAGNVPPTVKPDTHSSDNSGETSIFIKGDKKIHQINFTDILYLESSGSYVKFHINGGMIMTLDRLAKFESSLPENDFLRVHKSFIIATRKIDVIEGNSVLINGQRIPVGKMYKHNLDEFLNR